MLNRLNGVDMPALCRRIYRILALLAWFAIAGSTAVLRFRPGWPGIRNVSIVAKMWGGGIAKILGLEITVKGDADNFAHSLIVSNHLGYIDIIVHAAIFPLRFCPKADIAKWPGLGWYLRLNRPIWVDRTSTTKAKATMEEMLETIRHGVPLIVYPEGTSSSGKDGLLPFKSTAFEAAARGPFKILPTLVRYLDDGDGIEVSWYADDDPLLSSIWRILGKRRIRAEVTIFDAIDPDGMDRKTMAKHVHDILEREYLKIAGTKTEVG